MRAIGFVFIILWVIVQQSSRFVPLSQMIIVSQQLQFLGLQRHRQ